MKTYKLVKCEVCNTTFPYYRMIDGGHHLSYKENITIECCKVCHYLIHNSDKYPSLKPIDSPKPPQLKIGNTRITIIISKALIFWLDEQIKKKYYANRSHFFEKMMRDNTHKNQNPCPNLKITLPKPKK